MWCLETIKALNQELAKGKTPGDAERAVGIQTIATKEEALKIAGEKAESNGKKVA